mmetsp:Transcript_41248/g.93979  ORF Transcript_41248/g.93979 Transcript_41248/m.93979 type:complete len:243 (+) Transcript_41248:36-764(+)
MARPALALLLLSGFALHAAAFAPCIAPSRASLLSTREPLAKRWGPQNTGLLSLAASGLAEEADRARVAAEEAAQRAARLRAGPSPSTPAPVKAPFKNAGEALRRMEAEEGGARGGVEEGRRFSREFKDFALDKPMGMVLEENHESVMGVVITGVSQGSNAEKAGVQPASQIVEVAGKNLMGASFEQVMDAMREAEAPVPIKLFQGSASSLYGGWAEEAKGREVTVIPTRPSKALIDRVRSGL